MGCVCGGEETVNSHVRVKICAGLLQAICGFAAAEALL